MRTPGSAREANLRANLKRELDALITAFSFFTRLPLTPKNFELEKGVLYLPVVGLFLGGLSYLLALKVPLTDEPLAFFILAVGYFLADYFHFDGLLDTVDALAAGGDRKKRLEVLKGPEVGALGLLFAFFFLLGEFLLAKEALLKKAYLVFWLRPLAGRLALALVALLGRPAKPEGLGALFMAGSRRRLLLSQLLWLPLLYFAPLASLAVLFLVFFLKHRFERLFGGLTGDLLGATLMLSQWVFLAVFLVGLPFKPW